MLPPAHARPAGGNQGPAPRADQCSLPHYWDGNRIPRELLGVVYVWLAARIAGAGVFDPNTECDHDNGGGGASGGVVYGGVGADVWGRVGGVAGLCGAVSVGDEIGGSVGRDAVFGGDGVFCAVSGGRVGCEAGREGGG